MEHTVVVHKGRISVMHLWHSGEIRGNPLACLSAYVLQLLRVGTILARVQECKRHHTRCNFVMIRYGGVGLDFVRESIMVCLSAHIMQKLFLTWPGNIET